MGGFTDLVKGGETKYLAKVNGEDNGGILGLETINGFAHDGLGQLQRRGGDFLDFSGPGERTIRQETDLCNK